jgi:hypothetical protein
MRWCQGAQEEAFLAGRLRPSLGPRRRIRAVAADSYPDLLERLFAAFEDRHTIAVIEDVARQCRDELTGQTAPGAQFELLERLVRQRLADLAPTR